MANTVSICNLALSHLGKPPINALTERSAEAVACNTFYNQARQTLLQSSGWTFAKRREPLAETTPDFIDRWAKTYLRPGDALSILRVYPSGHAPYMGGPTPPFEVREGRVYCNVDLAVCEYVFDQTDAGQFSPLFVDALSYWLAQLLSRPLTRSAKLTEEMRAEARNARSLAITADAAQEPQTYLFGDNAYTPDYTAARG